MSLRVRETCPVMCWPDKRSSLSALSPAAGTASAFSR